MSSDQTATPAPKVRLPYYDNVKFFLIVCVVIGHILKFGAMDVSSAARGLSVFIYSFHMPLFIFLSGLFLKRERITTAGTLRHAAQYLAFYVLAKVLRKAVPFMLGEPVAIDLLNEGGLPWFMLALAAYYLLAWALQFCNYYLVLGVSVCVALVAGNYEAIGDFLCLSRVIVFFPFFWLGHMMQAGPVTHHFESKMRKGFCALILFVSACLCIKFADQIFGYRDLFLGRHCYTLTPIEGCSWLNRLWGYGASLIMSYAFLGVVPQGHIPLISTFGKRTLQVYLLHYEVIELLWVYGVIGQILALGDEGWVLFVPLALLIALVLSVPTIPRLPRPQQDEKKTLGKHSR